ncbi:MAG TPA: response regulator, partial [Atribacterota bacterium]|nr:response regulator [Atribacterota bacterium]
KKQILLVDGDVMLAERLKRNLELENYIVDLAYRGSDALTILKRKWVDLIISSITLQGNMNGIQLLQDIIKNEDFNKIPVIIISGKINLEKTAYDIGAKLFVTKPYDTLELIKNIKDVFQEEL